MHASVNATVKAGVFVSVWVCVCMFGLKSIFVFGLFKLPAAAAAAD